MCLANSNVIIRMYDEVKNDPGILEDVLSIVIPNVNSENYPFSLATSVNISPDLAICSVITLVKPI